MTLVGFVVHGGRESAVRTAIGLIRSLAERGLQVRILDDDPIHSSAPAAGIEALTREANAELSSPSAFSGGLDLVVSVGGDGTFLRAAHYAMEVDRPVVGVNVGHMGFLTPVDPADAEAVIARALDGTAVIEERGGVVAEAVAGTSWTQPRWGLNEVMVEKGTRHRVVRVGVWLAGEYVTTFSGDGVIVATATGSTAYSFSARGPIVSPGVPCLVVTPIAAHMVFDRSFVIGLGEHVEIEVREGDDGVLSTDGKESLPLPVGARVRIRASDRPARVVRPPGSESFFRRVRRRFSLPDGTVPDPPRDPPPPASG
ncbi:MAG TPA: NAD(+)/NADH kinase [Actinomycetota bacterium]